MSVSTVTHLIDPSNSVIMRKQMEVWDLLDKAGIPDEFTLHSMMKKSKVGTISLLRECGLTETEVATLTNLVEIPISHKDMGKSKTSSMEKPKIIVYRDGRPLMGVLASMAKDGDVSYLWNKPIYFNFEDLLQGGLRVYGEKRTGKTNAMRDIGEGMSLQGTPVFFFDPEGDYNKMGEPAKKLKWEQIEHNPIELCKVVEVFRAYDYKISLSTFSKAELLELLRGAGKMSDAETGLLSTLLTYIDTREVSLLVDILEESVIPEGRSFKMKNIAKVFTELASVSKVTKLSLKNKLLEIQRMRCFKGKKEFDVKKMCTTVMQKIQKEEMPLGRINVIDLRMYHDPKEKKMVVYYILKELTKIVTIKNQKKSAFVVLEEAPMYIAKYTTALNNIITAYVQRGSKARLGIAVIARQFGNIYYEIRQEIKNIMVFRMVRGSKDSAAHFIDNVKITLDELIHTTRLETGVCWFAGDATNGAWIEGGIKDYKKHRLRMILLLRPSTCEEGIRRLWFCPEENRKTF